MKKHYKGKTVYKRYWVADEPSWKDKHTKQVKVILTVAHLDNDRANFKVQLERLMHLCQLCHLQRDAFYKAYNRKFLSASQSVAVAPLLCIAQAVPAQHATAATAQIKIDSG